jgi:hypothetical protein
VAYAPLPNIHLSVSNERAIRNPPLKQLQNQHLAASMTCQQSGPRGSKAVGIADIGENFPAISDGLKRRICKPFNSNMIEMTTIGPCIAVSLLGISPRPSARLSGDSGLKREQTVGLLGSRKLGLTWN